MLFNVSYYPLLQYVTTLYVSYYTLLKYVTILHVSYYTLLKYVTTLHISCTFTSVCYFTSNKLLTLYCSMLLHLT